MLSSVLRSRRAVLVNVEIMRAFVALRREVGRYEALGRTLAELERTQNLHGEDIQMIFAALRQLGKRCQVVATNLRRSKPVKCVYAS